MSPRENITALVLETNEDEEPCVECMKHTEALDRFYANERLLTEQLAEAKARLRDIVQGADMMLQPALKVRGSMRGYLLEVKRVAGTPL